MPKVDGSYPAPSKILSRENLLTAWKYSRDSKTQAGSRGSDGISARTFSADLDANLRRLAADLTKGDFQFSRLRPLPIAKPGSTKDRLICIPTVKDRLVQRRISFYLHHRKLFPIYNPSSFGFIPDEGAKKALSKAIELRSKYEFCFETDIIGFFDRINRGQVTEYVKAALGRHSLVPLIVRAINTEIAPSKFCGSARIAALGIKEGEGIRQGMPLSPILSNLALSSFDKAIHDRGIPMVRYADDIITFASTKAEALENGDFLREELKKYGHSIPLIEALSKTRVAGKFDELNFLGREICFSEKADRYIQKVSNKKILSIVDKMKEDASPQTFIKANSNFLDLNRNLAQTVASYISSYRDAHNARHVEYELRGAAKKILKSVYSEIFGLTAVEKAGEKYAKFLGVDILDISASEMYDVF